MHLVEVDLELREIKTGWRRAATSFRTTRKPAGVCPELSQLEEKIMVGTLSTAHPGLENEILGKSWLAPCLEFSLFGKENRGWCLDNVQFKLDRKKPGWRLVENPSTN